MYERRRRPLKGNVFLLPTMTAAVTLLILVFKPLGGQRGNAIKLSGLPVGEHIGSPLQSHKTRDLVEADR